MRRCIGLLTGLMVLVAAPAGATTGAAEPRSLEVAIEQVTTQPDGSTSATVAVAGLPPGATVALDELEIVENGEPVAGLRLAGQEEIEQTGIVPAVVLAMDVSGSTEGEPIAAAKAAAVSLLQDLEEGGAAVGLVAFGEVTSTLATLDADASAAIGAAGGITASGGTALYDGVSRAVRMVAQHDGPLDVIVFSDGEDTTSGSTLDDVRALLADTGVRVTSVLLRSDGVAVAPLRAIAEVNGGRLVEVDDAAQLGAAFEAIAGDLTNRLQVEWTAGPVPNPPRTLNVVATYRSEDLVASDGTQVESSRLAAVAPPRAVDAPDPIVPALGGRTGLIVATAAVGVSLLLLLFLILASSGERRRRGRLDERLAAYQPNVGERGREDHVSLSDRASSAFDVIPRPANLDRRIAESIEHADWPLRVIEFILISFGTGVFALLVGGVLLGSWVVGGVALIAGLAAPWMALRVAVSRRRAAFAEQLPTVLQVLAGALRAGHAFSTALDGAVDEVDEPAKGELRRAAVEARLGRPLDRALYGVSTRMDSVDLQWVIGALEVQREVGGNLAEILSNVAATLRDRSSVARHVKALTAEGRLSAVFIAAMPFVMFLFLTVTNPTYVRPLFETPLGRFMLLAGFVLLLIGIVVLRRLVRPKY